MTILGVLFVAPMLVGSSCTDPPDPGGLVLTVAVATTDRDDIDRLEIDVQEVEVNYTSDETGEDLWASVAQEIPTIVVQNRTSETVVGLFQVLPGVVNQVRIHPTSVRLIRRDGGVVELLDRSRPSQAQTGEWR